MAPQITALVTGAGGAFGDATVRALRFSSLDIRVVAVDCDRSASGLFLADDAYVVPRASAPDYIDTLAGIAREAGADIVFIASSTEIPVTSNHRNELEAKSNAVIVVNSRETLRITEDKWETNTFLSSAGFDVPRSTIDTDEEALGEFVAKVGLPVIAKPRRGGGSKGLRVCEDLTSVLAAMRPPAQMITQEQIGDVDHEYTVGVIATEEGQVLGSVTLRRYLKNGMTGAAEVVNLPKIKCYAEAIGRLVRPRGYCNVQLRTRGDRPFAFEINGRISSSTGFRALAGFNEPDIIIRHYILGETVQIPPIEERTMIRGYLEREVPRDVWRRIVSL